MDLTIELELEEDGRWIAGVVNLAGVLVYGQSQEDAVAKVKALALWVVADQIEHGERSPELDQVLDNLPSLLAMRLNSVT